MNKIVIYTAAFGEGYGFIPQKKIKGIDFICFTDNLKKVPKPWHRVLFEPKNLSDHLRNRYVKLLPHKVLSDYEISIYIDSNFIVIGDIHLLLRKLEPFKMATFDHNQSEDHRDCIYDEYKAIIEMIGISGVVKDDPEVMKKQIDQFKLEGYPKHNGLIKGGVLIRKHNDEEVIALMNDWWEIVSKQSKRDQLSFNYVTWKRQFDSKIIPGDIRRGNPYFYFIGMARNDYTFKFIRYKLKKFFEIIKHPKP